MSKKTKLILGVAISAVFLYLAFRDVELFRIIDILKNANYLYVIMAAIVTLISHWMRAYRWKFLLRPLKEVNTWPLFKVTIIAFLSNNVLPFRMAEFVRAYLLGEKENISKTASFATIVLERFFDLAGILIISSIFFTFSEVPDYLKKAGFLLMLFGVFFIVFIVFVKYKHDLIHKLINKFMAHFAEKHVHKIAELVNSFVAGLESFSSLNQIMWILFLSLFVWFFNLACFYYISLTFGLTFPFWKNFFPFLYVILGVMIPSAPGFIGTFHEFCRRGLIEAGVTDNNIAVSYAVLIHGMQYILITILGVYFLWTERISLSKFTEKEIE